MHNPHSSGDDAHESESATVDAGADICPESTRDHLRYFEPNDHAHGVTKDYPEEEQPTDW